MKVLTVLGVVVALSCAAVYAQSSTDPAVAERSTMGRLQSYQECDLQKLEASLLISLRHDVEGVVTSALREVAKIKLAQPSCSSDAIAAQVDELMSGGATPAIRYKAYLTSIVLSTPHSFVEEGVAEFQTDEQFFTALAHKLEKLVLSDEL